MAWEAALPACPALHTATGSHSRGVQPRRLADNPTRRVLQAPPTVDGSSGAVTAPRPLPRGMQRAALVSLGRGLAPLRAAVAVQRPQAAARRALRVLTSTGGSSSGSGAEEQQRGLVKQAITRQHSAAAGGAGAGAGSWADQPRAGIMRRLLLSGAAGAALLACAMWPRPAAAFQLPGLGGPPPAAAAAAAVDAVPVSMEDKVGMRRWGQCWSNTLCLLWVLPAHSSRPALSQRWPPVLLPHCCMLPLLPGLFPAACPALACCLRPSCVAPPSSGCSDAAAAAVGADPRGAAGGGAVQGEHVSWLEGLGVGVGAEREAAG